MPGVVYLPRAMCEKVDLAKAGGRRKSPKVAASCDLLCDLPCISPGARRPKSQVAAGARAHAGGEEHADEDEVAQRNQ